jgi:phospholipid/cholesterol/gamma-HCH transport system substrate-binding protein
MSRRPQASIVASPVLIGAVTLLVTIVAVFLAYNANTGLPFVPTYDVRAELPSGGKLVRGNEVRVGGFRVGLVEDIKPTVVDGKSVALVKLKLDKVVDPLPVDTTIRVRPRSALGLRYVQITPGKSDQMLEAGDTIPLKNTSESLDLEDIYAVFQGKTRNHVRAATAGFGDAFAGRGPSINQAIESLNPFFLYLTPVMQNLSDPKTDLDQFFRALGRASAEAAPVAHAQATVFTHMADTFEAFVREPTKLQQTIEKSPPTIDVSVASFRVQRPFLNDFADLSRRLRPAAQELPRSLPAINAAFKTGTPVLPRTVELNNRLTDSFNALDDLFQAPATLLALKDIRTALAVARPALEFIAPYQTVCNQTMYFIHPLGEVQSQVQNGPTGGGTVLQQGVKLVDNDQPNSYGTSEGSRPVDIPADENPIGYNRQPGDHPQMRLYAWPYPPAVDAQGNADCQGASAGYIKGPLASNARYAHGEHIEEGPLPGVTFDDTEVPNGGNWAVTDHYPVNSGGTYVSEALGIHNLRDVP